MLEHLVNKSGAEKNVAIHDAFHSVFATEQGVLALTVILDELFYFVPTKGEGEQACNNVAKDILGRCGIEIASKVFEAWKNLTVVRKEKPNAE